jgi:uncharacterized protein
MSVMVQAWRAVTFLHWRYPVDAVARLLPDGLHVDTHQGQAWVGLIPLLMDGVRAAGLPALPWLSRFPETNLRTYVRAPDGGTGIWFFSLDAARLPVVTAARLGVGLPYMWSRMSVRHSGTAAGDWISYRSRRLLPGPAGAVCDLDVVAGAPLPPAEPGSLEHFLTERYRLYSVWAGRLVRADARHRQWPLREARVQLLRQSLTAAAGLPEPEHEALVHASPGGVVARIGMRRPARPPRSPRRA